MFPEESVIAFKDLKAKTFFPVHWRMFEMAYHPRDEPITRLSELAKIHQIRWIAPQLGQVVDLENAPKYEPWWQQ